MFNGGQFPALSIHPIDTDFKLLDLTQVVYSHNEMRGSGTLSGT